MVPGDEASRVYILCEHEYPKDQNPIIELIMYDDGLYCVEFPVLVTIHSCYITVLCIIKSLLGSNSCQGAERKSRGKYYDSFSN